MSVCPYLLLIGGGGGRSQDRAGADRGGATTFAGNGNDNSGDGSGSPGDALSGGPSGDFDNLSDQMPTEMPTSQF